MIATTMLQRFQMHKNLSNLMKENKEMHINELLSN